MNTGTEECMEIFSSLVFLNDKEMKSFHILSKK